MSTSISAEPTGDVEPPSPLSDRDRQKAHALGLTSATGLVIGSVVGTGVFTMPALLAGTGTMSIIVLAVVAAGALVLALLFGQLTQRVPNSDGAKPGRRRRRGVSASSDGHIPRWVRC